MSETAPQTLDRILETQRRAFVAARPESLSVRRDRIKRAMSILSQHGESLAEAMNSDFGSRSFEGSMMTDIVSTIGFGKYCLKNMEHWAAPDKRSVRFPLGLMGAKAEVRYEPKGVIGIMSPWNFPVNLSFGPLMQVLAAGKSARLYRALTDPGLSTSAAAYFPRLRDPGLFIAYATLAPDVAHETAEAALKDALQAIAAAIARDQQRVGLVDLLNATEFPIVLAIVQAPLLLDDPREVVAKGVTGAIEVEPDLPLQVDLVRWGVDLSATSGLERK